MARMKQNVRTKTEEEASKAKDDDAVEEEITSFGELIRVHVASDGRENSFLDVRVNDSVDEKVRDGLEVTVGRQITVLLGGCYITEGSFEENGIEVGAHQGKN